mmetsp:Transcript_32994/g.91012  ORF Transcript_32994/g.91012 Transcript_32994/m.91012 type:complete len:205 (-) Transcript_32994:1591-2205(-)
MARILACDVRPSRSSNRRCATAIQSSCFLANSPMLAVCLSFNEQYDFKCSPRSACNSHCKEASSVRTAPIEFCVSVCASETSVCIIFSKALSRSFDSSTAALSCCAEAAATLASSRILRCSSWFPSCCAFFSSSKALACATWTPSHRRARAGTCSSASCRTSLSQPTSRPFNSTVFVRSSSAISPDALLLASACSRSLRSKPSA